MELIHFGDIHVWKLALVWNDLLYPKRILGPINLALNRRRKFPPAFGESVVREIAKRDADLVVFTGDMTTQSLQEEFDQSARLFEPLRKKWGDRFFVIPGNHDRYTPKSVRLGFYENYFPYGTVNPDTGIRTLEVGPEWVVVGFDCSRPFRVRSNGLFEPRHAEGLGRELEHHRRTGKRVILAGHFPYASPEAHPEHWEHKLLNDTLLAELVAEFKPAVYLHGHKHVRWLLRPETTPDTPCANCGSAGMKAASPDRRAGFVVLHLSDAGRLESAESVVLRADDQFDENPMTIP